MNTVAYSRGFSYNAQCQINLWAKKVFAWGSDDKNRKPVTCRRNIAQCGIDPVVQRAILHKGAYFPWDAPIRQKK